MSADIELVRCDISYDESDKDPGVVIKIIYRENGNLITMSPIVGDVDLLTEIVIRELSDIGVIKDGRKDKETRH